MTSITIPQCIDLLEQTGDFRVVRRFRPVDRYHERGDGEPFKTGLVIDTETTGLEENASIIEFGALPFSFCPTTGRIFEVGTPLSMFEDPGVPLSPEIVSITGITDDMVRGLGFDDCLVESLCAAADLVIAHNADFDRPKVERRFPCFAAKHWSCSVSDVDWKAEGIESQKLAFIAYRLGFFFDAHRAGNDCQAVVHALAQTLPVSGRPVMQALLDAARRPSYRVWSVHSPFEMKDALKARGYRWSAGEAGRPKAWFRDMTTAEAAEAESAFLAASRCRAQVVSIGGKDKFSDRAYRL
jgi:DNA polymerase-3 subunit epsilon